MYSYVDLTAPVLNCRLPTTRHINYIGLPKLVQFSDNVITFAVNGLLYPYFA